MDFERGWTPDTKGLARSFTHLSPPHPNSHVRRDMAGTKSFL